MATSTSRLVQSGEQRVLSLTTLDLGDAGRFLLLQIRPFVPDPGQRMIAAFPNRPHNDRHRLSGSLDIQGSVVQPSTRHEEERSKIGIGLFDNPNGITER
jgi:hypothetical protein